MIQMNIQSSFVNPVLGGDYPDPSVIRVGCDYYMTHSSFRYYPGLLIWHSKDLVNWRPLCHALHEYVGDVWAPDFIQYEGRYYIYFPAGGTNWVVTAISPGGPWSKPIDLKVSHIDPGHVAGADGKRYLHLSGGHIVELARDGLSVIGTPRKIYDGWLYPNEWRVEGFCLESPKLIFKNGYYYLTSAQGGTAGPATSHMVVSARSHNPWGPWENSPHNPIVRTVHRDEAWHSKGHGTIFEDSDGKWWIIYHGYEKGYYTLGRQTLLEAIQWTEDDWFKTCEGVRIDQPATKSVGSTIGHELNSSEILLDGEISLKWQCYDALIHDRCRVEKGGLILMPLPPGEQMSPLVYIAHEHCYTIEAKLSLLSDDSEGRLLLFYNRECYTGIGFNREGVYAIRQTKNLRPRPVGSRTLELKLVNDHHEVDCYYRIDEEEWVKLPESMDTSGYHHNALGQFLSLRPGVDASGGGEVFVEYVRII
ncbi:family 43 glycosylhydrolase [Paenibacillus sp. PL2-23]|uniref:family 43 glycosylhydrolase n=1 Tax=Paenibacillus sp. PL2-23 TaxID=2100729 RepID=UPI0030F70DC3